MSIVRTGQPEYDEGKFEELLIYITGKCADKVLFGATKLNKLLFYSDFLAYRNLGRPITGAEYVARKYGPTPRRLVPVREKLAKEKAVGLYRSGSQERIVPLREADLTMFEASEISLVDTLIATLEGHDAEAVSELSHAFLGWKAAWAEGQASGGTVTIPYETVFVSNRPLDKFEEAHALELAGRHGWL